MPKKAAVKPDFKGKTRREVLLEINEIAKDCRPLGNVKAIMKSPNREKEHMVTLVIQDKRRLEDDTFIKLITGQSNGGIKGKEASIIGNKIAANSGIYAVPVSKKLPWMTISNVP